MIEKPNPWDDDDDRTKLPWWERGLRWMIDDLHWHAEYREALRAHKKRTELRTRLQEARTRAKIMATDQEWQARKDWLATREKLSKELRTVAVWEHAHGRYLGKERVSVLSRCSLQESKTERVVELKSTTRRDTGQVLPISDTTKEYLLTTPSYVRHIAPWRLGKRTLAELKEALGDDLIVY